MKERMRFLRIGCALAVVLVVVFHLAGIACADSLTIERMLSAPSLNGPTPRGVRISPDGRMVGFLRASDSDIHQLDLWVYDIGKKATRLLVDSKKLVPEEKLTDVERARRERQRTASYHGILAYEWAPDSRKLLFPIGDKLYLYDLTAKQGTRVRTLVDGLEATDPQISPKGRYVSFVRDQNLFVLDLAQNLLRQLTQDGGGTIHEAEAEFIAQEEMDEDRGYWWAPDDGLIAFKRYDESSVPLTNRFEMYADRTEVVEQRYPYAGDANVVVQLGLISPEGGAARWVDLGPDPDIYLARVKWMPDAKTLTYQRESRDQKRLDLMAVNVESLNQKPLITETSKTWINLNNDLHFLKKRKAFIWGSERSGFEQLYLYDLDGNLIRPLTQGAWDVDYLLAVDETTHRVYFASNRDAVIDRQVYTVRYDTDTMTAPVRITPNDGWYAAIFPKDADKIALFVEGFSSPQVPPQYAICDADGHRLTWLEQNKLDAQHPYWPYHDLHVVPEYGTLQAEDGETLYYSILKPPDFDPSGQYPVIVDVYGGPSSQQVRRSWGSMFHQFLAQQGYIVFQLDNRGSARRGRHFQDQIYHRMGDVEVRDQLVGVQWLKQQPYVDAGHIGVYGWSYGGYMVVMLLAKASDELAAGAAGAPVTDWHLYDTHYTEHYLGSPVTNAAGYDSSGVFVWLPGMANDKLLLIHGMADDNVLFQNSTELMSALQDQGTQFRLMTYPGGAHGLPTSALRKHEYHLIVDFFDEKLKH